MEHTSRSLLSGGTGFWDLGIFYPLRDTLCLSETMLTPAVLLSPLIALTGPAPTINVWIYLSWFSTAIAAWVFLRHRGLDWLAAFWGAFCVTFSLDRLWHGSGHMHLVFQAGFPLVLLAFERSAYPRASRLWGLLFGVTVLVQVFCGFYLTVLFSLWVLVLVPVSLYSVRKMQRRLGWDMRPQWSQMAIWCVLTAALLLPIVLRYREYGRHFPQNPLTAVAANSADWRGYLLPPADRRHFATMPGILCAKLVGEGDRGENTQQIGFTPLALICVAFALGLARRVRPRRETASGLAPSAPPADLHRGCDAVWIGGLVAVASMAFVLSLGPYLYRDFSKLTRLPFAYLYGWFEPLRFFRAPARLAFLVHWCVGFAAAWSLWRLRQDLVRWGRQRGALILGVGAMICIMFEYLPVRPRLTFPIARDGLARWLAKEHTSEPYAEIPAYYPDIMIRLGWTNVPTANGSSGYTPPLRYQEVIFLEKNFPSPESWMLLERWRISRVFVSSTFAPPDRASRFSSPILHKLWQGEEGTLYTFAHKPPDFQDYLARRRAALRKTSETARLVLIEGYGVTRDCALRTNMHYRPPDAGFAGRHYVSVNARPSITLNLKPGLLQPALHTRLRMRVAIANWYDSIEPGGIYWTTTDSGTFSPERLVSFPIPADGEFHELDIELGRLITWITDAPPNRLRVEFGGQINARVAVESLIVEEAPVHWQIGVRDVY